MKKKQFKNYSFNWGSFVSVYKFKRKFGRKLCQFTQKLVICYFRSTKLIKNLKKENENHLVYKNFKILQKNLWKVCNYCSRFWGNFEKNFIVYLLENNFDLILKK